MDAGIVATGLVLGATLIWGRSVRLRVLLALMWLTGFFGYALGADMASLVLAAAMMDLVIVLIATAIVTNDPSRVDARAVGVVSLAMMPAHWIMSATKGAPDWTAYALACNIGFVLQCLIVGGWLDGVARSARRFLGRIVPVSLFRGRGR